MPLHEKSLFRVGIPADRAASRDSKLYIADAALAHAVSFINYAIEKNKLSLPKFPPSYDPSNPSRWLYFFLRETIRNSVDAFFAQDNLPSPTIEINIIISTQAKTGQLYLKIKDNGPGFAGVGRGISFTKEPAKAYKEKMTCIGGNGFGLGICQSKLSDLIFKNRKAGGATVKTALGKDSSLVLGS